MHSEERGVEEGVIQLSSYALSWITPQRTWSLPWTAIWTMKAAKSKKKEELVLDVRPKQGSRVKFIVPGGMVVADQLAVLQQMIPTQMGDTFAFLSKESFSVDGWAWFDVQRDLERVMKGHSGWRISQANVAYELCPTYPPVLGVPASMSDQELGRIAQFRSSSRVPALSWLHPVNGAALVRCAQPLIGLKRRRCFEDEKMVCNMRESNPNRANDTFYIIDARPLANVLANKAIGGGIEDKDNYPDCAIELLDMHNIHVVRESYTKALRIASASSTDTHFYASFDATNWLALLRTVLRGTARIVEVMSAGHSVLTHCSDGWDRTSQLTSLAMLAMDPCYRTLQGFACLVEKEWLAFGHKFAQRQGVADYYDDVEQMSPVFLQFVDCVHQLLRAHPTAFEFNHTLLVELVDASYSTRFGNFLYNNMRQRVENNVQQKTQSFWSFVGSQQARFTNQFYRPHPDTLRVVTQPVDIVFWDAFFSRHNSPTLATGQAMAKVMRDAKEQQESVWQQIDMMKSMIRTLDEENAKLRAAHK